MTLKNAALFAMTGMMLLTVLLAAGFIRDLLGFVGGAVAVIALLTSGIHLLAGLSAAVFLYVFHKTQA
jgi:tetrahydromethanopterin S-methyltransferase subunit D